MLVITRLQAILTNTFSQSRVNDAFLENYTLCDSIETKCDFLNCLTQLSGNYIGHTLFTL